MADRSIDVHLAVVSLLLCRLCGYEGPSERFQANGQRCKPCHAEASRQYRFKHPEKVAAAQKRWRDGGGSQRVRLAMYGLTPESFEALLAKQGGGCAVCGTRTPGFKNKGWHVDHDHRCCPGTKNSCGECVRGILCGPCNVGLGHFGDSVERLQAAISYLARDAMSLAEVCRNG